MRIFRHAEHRALVGVIACLGLSACSDRASESDDMEQDSSGSIRVIVVDLFHAEAATKTYFASGVVSLVTTPEGEPEVGFWSIASDSEPRRIPLGAGELRWREEERGLIVELHPDAIDNNVELLITGENGTWQYLTDAGVTESGTLRVTSDSVED